MRVAELRGGKRCTEQTRVGKGAGLRAKNGRVGGGFLIVGGVAFLVVLAVVARDSIWAPHLEIQSLEARCKSSLADKFAVARVVRSVDGVGTGAIDESDRRRWLDDSAGVVAAFNPIVVTLPNPLGRGSRVYPNGVTIVDDFRDINSAGRLILLHVLWKKGRSRPGYRWAEFRATDMEHVCTWIPI